MPGDPSSHEDNLARQREDESWNDFYRSLDEEYEREKDREYDERMSYDDQDD